jgi:hypothetical protein
MTSTSLERETIRAPGAVEATPPDVTPVEPRTEPFDWLFVSWRRPEPPTRNAPPRDMRITDAADVERTVAQFLARDAAHERYPYIFLSPALADAFAAGVVQVLGPAVTLADVQALLLPAEHMPGWGIVLFGYPHEARDEVRGHDGLLRVDSRKQHRTAGGAREFVEQAAYAALEAERDELQRQLDALEDAPVLPDRELQIVRQLREHVKQAALDWDGDVYSKVADWLPSVANLCMWLAKERATVTGEAPPVEAAPDPQLAEQVATVIGKWCETHRFGPRRADIEKKVSARHTVLTETLAWLARPGGEYIRRRRGKADEYVQAEAEG